MKQPFFIQDFMFGDHILPEKRLEAHQADNLGVLHRCEAFPSQPRSGQDIVLQVTIGGEATFDQVCAFYTCDDSAPQPETAQSVNFEWIKTGWDQVGWQYIQHWQAVLPGQPDQTMLRYQIAARRTASQRWVFADRQAEESAAATNFAIWVSDMPSPAWVQKAQIYHVFVDRFNVGAGKPWRQTEDLNGFFGGTLQGVIEKLDYIQNLGYNTVWLSPFFVSESHHGYDAIDMYTVDPRYGTNEDLYALIDALHKRGMRVILDFVANHWSNLHFSMQAAQKDRQSEYFDWYIWKQWPDTYEGFFDLLSMPQLNLQLGKPARKYLLDCAKFWLEKGFDGFRLDFAYGPPRDFWVDFRRTCKTAKPDSWLFGEVILPAQEQRHFDVAFDGMIDFLLADALRQTFGFGRWTLDKFDAFLTRHEAYFRGVFERLTILDNHDMNRFLFLAGNDPAKLKLGALVLYTLNGKPINYYGTEAGVTQKMPIHHDDRGFFEEARAPMLWGADQNSDLAEFFRTLVALRSKYPGLAAGERQTVHLNSEQGTYAYLRRLDKESLLVVLNTSPEERIVSLTLDGFAGKTDLLSGQPIQNQNGRLEIRLGPQNGVVVA